MSISKSIQTFLNNRKGAAAAEYALILAIVAAGIAVAAFSLGDAVQKSISGATEQVTQCTPGGDTTNCS